MRKIDDADALKTAVDVELRGADLYERAAKIAKSPEMKALFIRLRDEEAQHAALFQEIGEAAQSDAARETYSDENALFLSAFAADIAFSGGLMRIARDDGLSNPRAVFDEAIASEKNSILLYESIIDATKNADIADSLREIVRQERGHLLELMEQRDALK